MQDSRKTIEKMEAAVEKYLYYDQCRYELQKVPVKKYVSTGDITAKIWNKSLMIAVVITSRFLSVISINKFPQVVSISFERPVVSSSSG